MHLMMNLKQLKKKTIKCHSVRIVSLMLTLKITSTTSCLCSGQDVANVANQKQSRAGHSEQGSVI